jgi:hypothetical protein
MVELNIIDDTFYEILFSCHESFAKAIILPSTPSVAADGKIFLFFFITLFSALKVKWRELKLKSQGRNFLILLFHFMVVMFD